MGRSFKDYAKNYLFDSVCDEVEEFINNNFTELDIVSRRLSDFEDFEIIYYHFQKIYIDGNYYDDEFIIYFVVESEIALYHKDRRDDDFDTVNKWFLAKCSGSLADKFNSFSILEISEYESYPIIKNRLSDSFTPYIKKEDLEDKATEFLQKYYPEALNQKLIVRLEPRILAERLGLKIKEHEISEDNSIFGSIIFKSCKIETYDNDRTNIVNIDSGTIIVDPKIFYLRNIGSVNNTIVHECVHWVYHKKAFDLEHLYDSSLNLLACKVIGGISGSINESLKWIEWQANALAPRIQMPLEPFKIKCEDFIKNRLKGENKDFVIDVIELVIKDLSEFFGVSKLAAKIRMIDAGYEVAKGTYIYIDDRYVEPHFDKTYNLKKTETYSLSYFDFALEYLKNKSLRQLIESGRYIYIDSHVCIYDSKYITKDSFGNYKLTTYAKMNMFECCLIFEMINSYSKDSLRDGYATECFLCRIINQDFNFEVTFTPKGDDTESESMKKYLSEVSNVIKNLPVGLGDSLNYLIKISDKSIESIANDCCIDEKTIRRIKKEENNPSIRTLIAICIAMQVPPPIIKVLISKSSYKLQEHTEEGIALNLVIDTCRTIYDANNMLIELSQKPLTKKLE